MMFGVEAIHEWMFAPSFTTSAKPAPVEFNVWASLRIWVYIDGLEHVHHTIWEDQATVVDADGLVAVMGDRLASSFAAFAARFDKKGT